MTDVEIKQAHKTRADEFTRKQNENALLQRQFDESVRKMRESADKLSIVKEAFDFLTKLADSRRGTMKGKIEAIVSEALRLIYGPDYRVEISYSVKNNRSCLDIEMVRDTKAGEVRREIGGFGGGVADTISVPLRLMVLLGSKQKSKVVFLDECYKHMDTERVLLVAEFLKEVSKKLGLQIIMATHHDIISEGSDKSYNVTEKDGKSTVKYIERK